MNRAKSYCVVGITWAAQPSPERSVSRVTVPVAGKHAHAAGNQHQWGDEPKLSSTMALKRAAGRLGLLLLGVVFLAIVPTVVAADDTVAFTIQDGRITGSSGLAVDAASNLYWTVNDSGNRGVVYGMGLDGTVQGTLNFRARPRDVEAVAVHEDRLYVADIGDNNGQRSFVRVYFFENPRANGLTVMYYAYDFRYPDGPHNAETLLVDDSGRLFIVTKGWKAAIYEAPAKPDRAIPMVAQFVVGIGMREYIERPMIEREPTHHVGELSGRKRDLETPSRVWANRSLVKAADLDGTAKLLGHYFPEFPRGVATDGVEIDVRVPALDARYIEMRHRLSFDPTRRSQPLTESDAAVRVCIKWYGWRASCPRPAA